MKTIFYDLETTGLANACGIHQISLILTNQHQLIDEFVFNVNPGQVRYEQVALDLAKKTIDDINNHTPILEVKRVFDTVLSKHINVDDPSDRWTLCGYNNRRFDNRFWHSLYESDQPNNFNQIYLPNTLDVFVMVKEYFSTLDRRPPKLNLGIVAEWFGIEVDESKLHTALYDAYLTKEIFMIINSLNKHNG